MYSQLSLEQYKLNLQQFAEGGEGGAEGTGTEAVNGENNNRSVEDFASSYFKSKGVKDNPYETAKYGREASEVSDPDSQENGESKPTEKSNEQRRADFEALISGEYADLYGEKVSKTIQDRFKNSKNAEDTLSKLAPTLELLANRYEVDPQDVEALSNAIQDDDSYYEDEALEHGMSVQDYKIFVKSERENAQFRKAEEQRQRQEYADRQYAEWLNQAEKVKEFYPSFDLNAEMQNEKFVRHLRSGDNIQDAYEAAHLHDILGTAMQEAVKKAEQKLSNSIRANGKRPNEAGNGTHSPSITKSNVNDFDNADIDEIIRRVRSGKTVYL